mmetsp:Transcript_27017/g.72700  ORF Transcript_27017/g.72700 Transcript_27017/m.72700 type:complete len:161 (+) Transcript_27017:199-681(+)|eukprot:CAMPEP_0119483670 /NCGR_PEP_ID=MMETSP1344-20130328/10971_1 /TAXON_ID=236787 /ORGANISM="Florenciella parvula, Strain CCMP2471" /LENGTH=160 /DNA_ID=CAMNT_0007518181 /DNA_START=309 /DNA_END=791 /DNA_ORIENTATION=-
MAQPADTSYGTVDPKLPASAQADVRIEQLMQMGFDAKLAERALRRANNNYEDAITMLSAGMVPEEDAFDVLAEAEDEGISGGSAGAQPSAPKTGEMKQSEDPFTANLPKGAPPSAILDSRIETLMGMGFEAADAENALRVAGDDFDVALQLLTSVDETSA